jgi:hypothetical protein
MLFRFVAQTNKQSTWFFETSPMPKLPSPVQRHHFAGKALPRPVFLVMANTPTLKIITITIPI